MPIADEKQSRRGDRIEFLLPLTGNIAVVCTSSTSGASPGQNQTFRVQAVDGAGTLKESVTLEGVWSRGALTKEGLAVCSLLVKGGKYSLIYTEYDSSLKEKHRNQLVSDQLVPPIVSFISGENETPKIAFISAIEGLLYVYDPVSGDKQSLSILEWDLTDLLFGLEIEKSFLLYGNKRGENKSIVPTCWILRKDK